MNTLSSVSLLRTALCRLHYSPISLLSRQFSTAPAALTTKNPKPEDVQAQEVAAQLKARDDLEVVLSKFHKNTDIKQIYKFLVRLGLKPDQVRMDKKETTQWYKVIVGFKEPAEAQRALAVSRSYFFAGKRTVNFARPNHERRFKNSGKTPVQFSSPQQQQ